MERHQLTKSALKKVPPPHPHDKPWLHTDRQKVYQSDYLLLHYVFHRPIRLPLTVLHLPSPNQITSYCTTSSIAQSNYLLLHYIFHRPIRLPLIALHLPSPNQITSYCTTSSIAQSDYLLLYYIFHRPISLPLTALRPPSPPPPPTTHSTSLDDCYLSATKADVITLITYATY